MADTEDVQEYGRKLQNQLEKLDAADIDDADREAIREFVDYLDVRTGNNQGTIVSNLNRLRLSAERDRHVKAALGDVVDLRARGLPGAADLEEQLENAIVVPAEEEPYFINRALDTLAHVEAAAVAADGAGEDDDETEVVDAVDEPAPEGVRWLDGERGVLELEFTRPMLEWLELEAREAGADSIPGGVRQQLWTTLAQDLYETHGPTATVEVELPDDFAHRVSL